MIHKTRRLNETPCSFSFDETVLFRIGELELSYPEKRRINNNVFQGKTDVYFWFMVYGNFSSVPKAISDVSDSPFNCWMRSTESVVP